MSEQVFTGLGERIFSFGLLFALIATVFVLALAGAGVDPGELSRFFMPMSWFYSTLEDIRSSLPKEQIDIGTASLIAGAAVVAGALQFVVNIVLGFLALVEVIASIIPSQLSFLIPPLYFIGGFLQFVLWVYAINLIFNLLRMRVTA